MSIKFNKQDALAYLSRLIAEEEASATSGRWVTYIAELSRLCAAGNASTHLAFLGTELLAKALNPKVDVYYIKPTKAPPEKKDTSYSARVLCHTVLVPLATEFNIDLGARGAEPLNNQPYFRMDYLGDGVAVHSSSRPAWEYMLGLIKKLENLNQGEAENALRAFIQVRRGAGTGYRNIDVADAIEGLKLADAIDKLVSADSEGGKRAQAAAAGVMDALYGESRVDTGSGRVNDPSRKRPGDVCVHSTTSDGSYEKSFEVKDKPVNATEVQLFIRNGLENFAVTDFGYLAVAENQSALDEGPIVVWAAERGADIIIFHHWRGFVRQALFWAPGKTDHLARVAADQIAKRLKEIEASADTVELWNSLIGK